MDSPPPPAQAAGHEVGVESVYVWDLRYPGAALFEGLDDLERSGRISVRSPSRQLSGAADVDGGKPQTKPLVCDPQGPPADRRHRRRLKQQFDLAIRIRDKTSEANQAVIDIRALKAQVVERVKNARSPAVGLAADVVEVKLGEVEETALPGSRTGGLPGC